jgi:hypothetical protein
MIVDEQRRVAVHAWGHRMQTAIAGMDAPAILKLLSEQALVEFTVGRRYRLVCLGGPVVGSAGLPAPDDSIVKGVGKLIGMDVVETMAGAGEVEFGATYRGRSRDPGNPHLFLMDNGQSAFLADMDIIASELRT